MLLYKVRVNEDDSKIYKIMNSVQYTLKTNDQIIIFDADYSDVKNDFSEINKLEILDNDEVISSYTIYDSFDGITYEPNAFDDQGHIVSAYSVHLTKTNLIDQVQRLEEQINPVVDISAMSTEQYRSYLLTQISTQCETDIYSGALITLSDGTERMFSYKEHDQINLKTLFDLVITNPAIQALPYHANSTSCEMLSRADIITIYTTLLFRLTRLTTWANTLNMYIKSLETKEELLEVSYTMTLPDEWMSNYNAVMEATEVEMQKILANIG